ncbi:MAG TPA: hypothetical protein VM074_10615 [Solimonas sp.]|nr:hypothetical protein [Solimonas sp.]
MSRAFGKWWDRRKLVNPNRVEADAGWKAGVQWALETAAERLQHGMTERERSAIADDERAMCIDEIKILASELPK